MKRSALLILCMIFSVCAFAQTFNFDYDDYESESESDDDFIFADLDYSLNSKGDQQIRIAGEGAFALRPKNLSWGGTASLGYQRFLNETFTVGADVNFSYFKTKGGNIFYLVPFMARTTLQSTIGKFEFPISLSAGLALQSYLTMFYLGPVIKPEIGAYYRYSPDWSLGLTIGTTIIPQIYFNNRSQNKTSTVIDAGLSVRYHF